MVMRIDLYNMKVLTYVLYNILLRMPGLMKKALEDRNIVPAYHILKLCHHTYFTEKLSFLWEDVSCVLSLECLHALTHAGLILTNL